MLKKSGILFLVVGTVFIFLALSLLQYNLKEDEAVGQETENLLKNVQRDIGDVSYIDGYEYIGVISIIDLDLDLPVMSEWDYSKLKLAPCRQFGSILTDDLVIAAHNYKSHFGSLKELKVGGNIIITDMNGETYSYEIIEIKTVEPTNVDEVQNSGYDLTLYTCTKSGQARVTVFCNKE